MNLRQLDEQVILFFRRVCVPFARVGLFVIFFWFGALKVVGLSPASDLVQSLFEQTVNFISFNHFMVLFGLFECLIGILFLIPGFERLVIPLLFIHMVTTFMPLFLLKEITWDGFFVPTLEGQYIIKNLVIIASAIAIAAELDPLTPNEKA